LIPQRSYLHRYSIPRTLFIMCNRMTAFVLFGRADFDPASVFPAFILLDFGKDRSQRY